MGDPYGADLDVYRRVFKEIQQYLQPLITQAANEEEAVDGTLQD